MSNELYDVLFEGVAEGWDPEQAKQAFAQLFRVDVASIERFFTAPKSVLKYGVDADTADKYIARLELIGIVASKSAINAPASPDSGLSLEPIVPVFPEASASLEAPGESFAPSSSAYAEENKSVSSRRVAFQFSGRGFEYFKIWIVNVLLSLLTLGIYSAWAKVRNKQYFYGNTQLDNASFEYTASPLKILAGRAIAVVFFVLYSVAGKISPLLALVFALLMMVFIPWIIVSSLRFNARHSSYRNINFRFVGSIWGAAKAFILWPFAAIFTLGILFPVVWKKQVSYTTNNHRYGAEPFAFAVSVKEYYKILLVLIGAGVLFFVVMTFGFGSTLMGLAGQSPAALMERLGVLVPALLAYFALYFLLIAYVASSMANIHFNNTSLQEHRFAANWSTGSYALLLFTNSVGILLTLGLFIPFARIRTAAYKAAHIEVLVSGDLERFIAAEQEQSHALGEGVHDIFDIDISL